VALKTKKLTNKQRDDVLNHLLQRVAMLEQMQYANENVLQMYVKFNEDTEKFNKWMTLIIENATKESIKDEKK
tara:strand:+ start:34 stop:252 length:219 start_codon:yes stop_codon:yes gene_type:complete